MTRPIMYQGEYYPSADSLITDGNGRKTKGRIFADANGQYYTLDGNGNLMEAMPVNNLDEVVITPGNQNVVSDTWDSPLTLKVRKASPKERSVNQQRQALMRAAGYNVPNDGSWGSYQQTVWDNLATKPKEYDTTLTGFAEGIWDKLTGNDTYKTNPLDQGTVRTYDPNNVDWGKTRRSQNKVINALSGTWLPGLATAGLPTLASAALSAPIATAVTTSGGAVGGYAVNKASEALTGNDFGTNVAMHTPLTPGMGDMLNPGYVAGGMGAERRMLDALYNQVTPVSYANTNQFSEYGSKSKFEELGLAAKDFFTPKKIKTSTSDIPAWRQRIEDNITEPSSRGQALFRDDAWRLATRQKPREISIDGKPHTLYNKNQDGTYSYDFDYINKVRKDIGMPPLSNDILPLVPNNGRMQEGFNKGWSRDNFTTNGGTIGIDFTLPNDWNMNPKRYHPSQIILKQPYRIHDKWDLQALKEENASLIPAFSRWLTRHPNKVTNHIRNMDFLQAVGGNPFMLDMQVAPDVINTWKGATKK